MTQFLGGKFYSHDFPVRAAGGGFFTGKGRASPELSVFGDAGQNAVQFPPLASHPLGLNTFNIHKLHA